MKKFLLLIFLFFGCLGTGTKTASFEIFPSTDSVLHLGKDVIFSYSEFADLNSSEWGAQIIENVEILNFGGEKALVLETSRNITAFAFDEFRRFLPFFGKEKKLPKEVYVYKNETIIKLGGNNSVGFFEEKNKLYMGKETTLTRMLDENRSYENFQEVVNYTKGNFVFLTSKYPSYPGFKTQTAVWGDMGGSETTRIRMKAVLNAIDANRSQINPSFDVNNLKSYYYEFFNSKPHLSVETVDITQRGTKIEIDMEIIGDFNELMKHID